MVSKKRLLIVLAILSLLLFSGCIVQEKAENKGLESTPAQETTLTETPTAAQESSPIPITSLPVETPEKTPEPTKTVTPKETPHSAETITPTPTPTTAQELDLSFDHFTRSETTGELLFYIKKDKAIECPPFSNKVFVDGKEVQTTFSGFSPPTSQEVIIKIQPLTGEHEITLLIDSENQVKETNEENNYITIAIR